MTKQQLDRQLQKGIVARLSEKLLTAFEHKKKGDRNTDRQYAQLLESRDRLKKQNR